MGFIIGLIVGVLSAGGVALAFLDKKRKELGARQRRAEAEQSRRDGALQEVAAKQQVDQSRLARALQELSAKQKAIGEETRRFAAARKEFDTRVVAYKDLQGENTLLKRDLRNLDVAWRKLQLDRDVQTKKQEELDQRGKDLGSRYLKENVKWIGSTLNENNFVTCKQRLLDVIERCRGIGCVVAADEEAALQAALKKEYEEVLRAVVDREEKARMKAQMREDLQREREKAEKERQVKRNEAERAAVEADRASKERERQAKERERAEVEARHRAEVDRIKSEMEVAQKSAAEIKAALAASETAFQGTIENLNAEIAARNAEISQKDTEIADKDRELEASRRELSEAEKGVRAGRVYVISNVGSFGEGVFKVGMTRRIEWEERIDELGDASVPFPFDIHMSIQAEDAPKLENALHNALSRYRMNKINLRKEYFRIDLPTIVDLVKQHHGDVQHESEPAKYRDYLEQVQNLTPEDAEFFEEVQDRLEEDEGPATDEA